MTRSGLCPENLLLALNRPAAIVAVLSVLMLAGSGLAAAQQEVVIYGFNAGADGSNPVAGLTTDGKGHLFGTTSDGGGNPACGHTSRGITGCGTVFELGPPLVGGHATETMLYVFQGGAGGSFPSTSLVFDAAGNLYGATAGGGTSGVGVVFELSPPQGTGPWTESVLYNFAPSAAGSSGLILDAQGNLYGESDGYPNGDGSVYELSPPAVQGGAWTYSQLLAFDGLHGLDPVGGLVSDAHGNLYGTTAGGGTGRGCASDPCGLVFELVKPALPGAWTEKVLYNFTGLNGDGGTPEAGVIVHDGVLYGTTAYGGNDLGDGTVFSLTPPKPGKGWTEATLFQFDRNLGGFRPDFGVVFDKAGNLYGTVFFGTMGGGQLFKLSPAGQGDPWTETATYNFTCGADGCSPEGNLISIGNWLYGTAQGGKRGDGVAYKFSE